MPRHLSQIDTRGNGEPCSHEHLHAPYPEGYLQHAAWAEEMLKTHDQQQCPGCGLWAVWVAKEG